METIEQLEETISQRIVQIKDLETWFGIELQNFSYAIVDDYYTSGELYFEIIATKALPLDFPFNIFAVVYNDQNKIYSTKAITIKKIRLEVFDIRSFSFHIGSVFDIEEKYEIPLMCIDEDTRKKESLRFHDKVFKRILIYPSKRKISRFYEFEADGYMRYKANQLEKELQNRIICDKEKELMFGIDFRNISISGNGIYLEIMSLSGNSLERPFFLRADVYDKTNNIIIKKKQHFKDLDLVNLEIAKIEIDRNTIDKLDDIEKIVIYPSPK